MNLEQQLLVLKKRKALQFEEIEMLSTVNEEVYTRFGKTCAEIMLKEKQLLRESNNILE